MEDLSKEGKGKKLDILDQWLKQTLNIGKTEQFERKAEPDHKQAFSPNGAAGQPEQKNGQTQRQPQSSQPARQPKQGQGQQGQQPGQPNQRQQHHRNSRPHSGPNFGGKFKGGKARDRRPRFKGGDNAFNQRHKFQSALSRAVNAEPGQVKYDPRGKLRIIPIGGLDEVGKNTMIFEYEDSIMLVDLGFHFPEADMLGVDYVIPDINYLKDKLHKIKGIVITHGHLDHIGGIPYLLEKLGNPPIYAGKLTMGLIKKQLEERGLLQSANLRAVNYSSDVLNLGKMKVSFYRITHSIPDACGLLIETPAGKVVHTGDFKIDLSPAGGQLPPEFAKIAALGESNVTLMLSDSTNATKPGYTVSEKKIGQTLDSIIKDTSGRLIIASFSSQIGRIQQIIDAAGKYGKKVFLSGRSLIDNSVMAAELGYLKYPQGLIADIKKAKKHPPEKTIILTTGSQGEPVAALSRMALKEHPHVEIGNGDTVVLSSSPIPGNETAVIRVTNNLVRLGARVINNNIMDVHASGHGQQEDLKLMFSLVKPKYFAPIHGEYFMRKAHAELMIHELGHAEERTIMIDNGDVLEMVNGEVKATGEKVQTSYILVDGMGGGDIGSQVMMDRQILAENGVIVLSMPIDPNTRKLNGDIDVETRGFIYMEESKEIINGICQKAAQAYREFADRNPNFNFEEAKLHIRSSVDQYVVSKIDRQPLIIPILVD